jgi:hypothetical protein
MRGLSGFVVAACVASFVATMWIVMLGDGQSLIASFRLPDLLGARLPELAINFRRLLAFYAQGSALVRVAIDLPFGIAIFLVVNLPGALLLWAAENAFGDAARWNTFKPLWSGLAYGLMAATFMLASFEWGLPLLAEIRLSPIGAALAALFAGSVLGLSPTRDGGDIGYTPLPPSRI